MTGFGRKGLEPGAIVAGTSAGFGRAIPASRVAPNDDVAAKREAFIQAERARQTAGNQPVQQMDNSPRRAGLSDYAENYRDQFTQAPDRSLALAYVLWFILGQISAHRFYLGKMQSACAQVGMLVGSVIIALSGLTMVGAIGILCWILWILGDVFFIHKMHRERCGSDPFARAVFS